jgi:outer membrane receptor protein involved in Fe transport
LGGAYYIRPSGTVFRASYNRNYQTPPNENLLLSSLSPLGDFVAPIRPQRENVYEAGMQQALPSGALLNLSVYHKDSLDQQDNNNFFNTGIIFPIALARIRVNGAEARLNLPAVGGFSGSISATHARAISTPPVTGGLFIGQDAINQLVTGPFVIDHDQKLSLNFAGRYAFTRNWWVSSVVRFDSGLVANPSNPAEVALDPDYFDLLPYVRLDRVPARVRPHTITDLAIGYRHYRGSDEQWDVQLQVNNVFDITALHNFQSVFVGTRLVAPRALGIRFRWHW